MLELVRNRIRCKKCNTTIESKSVHDFVMCPCGACFIDGGLEYRRIGGNQDDWEDLSEYKEVPGYYLEYVDMFGVYKSFSRPMTMDTINRNFDQIRYKLRLTDENNNVVFDSIGDILYEN